MKMTTFPISFWCSPNITFDRIKEMADCGFTVVPIPAATPQQGRQALDWLQTCGISGLIVDDRIHREMFGKAGWQDAVRAVVQDYADHPALWGYFITDEPHLDQFAALGAMTQEFLRLDPQHVPYINLFPNYASPDQLGTLDYQAHVRAYLETVRPPLLSYDHYGLMEYGDRPEYFPNLEVARAEALRAGVPFMNIVLSTPHFNYRDPSPADLRWEVYTTLAYGGKALAYFTYLTPDVENYRNGPLSIYEQKTPKYDMLRQLNQEVQRLGPWLLGLTSTGVYHWPAAPAGTTALDGSGLVASAEGGDLLVGEFADGQGFPWVLVMNKDREHAAWVTLHIKTSHRVVHEVSRGTGELRAIARDQGVDACRFYKDGVVARFWLAPADGRLMRFSS